MHSRNPPRPFGPRRATVGPRPRTAPRNQQRGRGVGTVERPQTSPLEIAVQNPSELFHFETDTDPQDVRASVLVLALGGFMDAGHTQRLLTEHLLATGESTVAASLDVDQLPDYRSRRPAW